MNALRSRPSLDGLVVALACLLLVCPRALSDDSTRRLPFPAQQFPIETDWIDGDPHQILGNLRDVAAADLDLDGDVDLVVAHLLAGRTTTMLGDGHGGFERIDEFPMLDEQFLEVELARVDRDRFPDLVLASRDTVLVRRGRGDGSFAELDLTLPALHQIRRLAVADVDADGWMDLVTLEHSGSFFEERGHVVVRFGAQQEPFRRQLVRSAPGHPSQFVIADLDADGSVDIVIAGSEIYTAGVGVLPGVAGQEVLGTTLRVPGIPGATGLEVADMNADGVLDLVTSSVGILRVDPGRGAFQFGAPIVTLTMTPGNGRLAVGDVDRDGIPDAVIDSWWEWSVEFFRGTGDGGFATSLSHHVGAEVERILLADIYERPGLELVVASGESGHLTVFAGGTPRGFARPLEIDTGLSGDNLAHGDFNEDGRDDLVVDGVTFLAGDHDTFVVGASAPESSTALPVVSDLDLDGHLDLALLQTSGFVVVRRGLGDGSFEPDLVFPTGAVAKWMVVLDANGDELPDLAVLNSSSQNKSEVVILLGTGGAQFSEPVSRVALGTAPHYRLATGDFDGDGAADLAVTSSAPALLRLIHGDGHGHFEVIHNFDAPNFPFFVDVADFNADGKDDVVVLNGASLIDVKLGDGHLGFQSVKTLAYGNKPWSSLEVTDLNQDGLPDLVTTQQDLARVSAYLGRGDGEFDRESWTVSPQVRRATVLDSDGDGWPEIAVSSPYAGATQCHCVRLLKRQ